MKTRQLIFLAVLTTFLWGSAFPCVKIGYQLFVIAKSDYNDTLLFAGIRFAIAGIMVIAYASIKERRIIRLKPSEAGRVLLLGFVQITMQYFFFYIGVAHTTGIKSSILYSINTVAAFIIAHFVYRDDGLSLKKTAGCILGLSGVVVVNMNGFALGDVSLLGEGCVILAAIAFALGGIINKKVVSDIDEYTATAYQLLMGGALLAAAGIVTGGTIEFTGFSADMMLIYLGVLSAAAFLIWSHLLKLNKVSKVTVFNFLIPVFGVILSALMLGENIFLLSNAAALVLVCSGIVLVTKN